MTGSVKRSGLMVDGSGPSGAGPGKRGPRPASGFCGEREAARWGTNASRSAKTGRIMQSRIFLITRMGATPLRAGKAWKNTATARHYFTAKRREIPLRCLRNVHNRNADGLELGDVHDVIAVEIVDLAVGDEIEIAAAQSSGCRQHGEGRAVFEHGRLCDTQAVFRKPERGDTRRADAVLDGDETAVVPVEAVNAGQRAMRTRIHVAARSAGQVHSDDAERVRDVEHAAIVRQRDTVWIEQCAVNPNGNKSFCRRQEAEDLIAQTVCRDDFAVLAHYKIV